MKFFLSIAAILIAVSVSHAITSISISGIKASATLPDLGQKTYRPENMVMKKNVHPFFQVWAAKYKEKPITLEFIVEGTKADGTTMIPGGLYVIEAGDSLITIVERKSSDFIQKLLNVGSALKQKKG